MILLDSDLPGCVDCDAETACRHPRLGPMCPDCLERRTTALRCRECGATGTLSQRRWNVCTCDAPLDRVLAADEPDVCRCGRCA